MSFAGRAPGKFSLTRVGPRLTMAAMGAPPVWLLDIDGVLNAISAEPDPSIWPAGEWIRAHAMCQGIDWPLLAARPVLDFIRRVHESGRAEIRWHTTWQREAPAAGRALKLPDFPVHPCPEFDAFLQQLGGAAPSGERWWKLPAADRVIGEEGRSLIWTDDDIGPQLRLYGQDHLILTKPVVLALSPDTRLGLTPEHLAVIDGFLDDVAAGRVPATAVDVGEDSAARRSRAVPEHRPTDAGEAAVDAGEGPAARRNRAVAERWPAESGKAADGADEGPAVHRGGAVAGEGPAEERAAAVDGGDRGQAPGRVQAADFPGTPERGDLGCGDEPDDRGAVAAPAPPVRRRLWKRGGRTPTASAARPRHRRR